MGGLVILGAGEAGVRAAFELREAGFAGPITLVGAEARLPYERPPLSKGGTLKPIRDEEAYAARGIDLRRAVAATAIDRAARRVTLSDRTSLSWDKLLIATGARPRLFPGMDAAATLRTAEDAASILGRLRPGARLAIVGGGFIGLELAATARALGASVTVIEAADRLMARAVPADIAAIVEARHRAEGVDIRLGAKVEAVGADAVRLAGGETIGADLVVAGVGATPNAELAAAAGLATDNGVAVDETLRTTDPDIFAAGDCASFPYRGRRVRLESWRGAQDMGAHAARAMQGDPAPYARVPWFWSDQYDLSLQVAGLADPAAATTRRDLGNGAFILFQTDADDRLVSASGIGPGNAVARDIRLAEMLIEKGVKTAPSSLADAAIGLKTLLRA